MKGVGIKHLVQGHHGFYEASRFSVAERKVNDSSYTMGYQESTDEFLGLESDIDAMNILCVLSFSPIIPRKDERVSSPDRRPDSCAQAPSSSAMYSHEYEYVGESGRRNFSRKFFSLLVEDLFAVAI